MVSHSVYASLFCLIVFLCACSFTVSVSLICPRVCVFVPVCVSLTVSPAMPLIALITFATDRSLQEPVLTPKRTQRASQANTMRRLSTSRAGSRRPSVSPTNSPPAAGAGSRKSSLTQQDNPRAGSRRSSLSPINTAGSRKSSLTQQGNSRAGSRKTSISPTSPELLDAKDAEAAAAEEPKLEPKPMESGIEAATLCNAAMPVSDPASPNLHIELNIWMQGGAQYNMSTPFTTVEMFEGLARVAYVKASEVVTPCITCLLPRDKHAPHNMFAVYHTTDSLCRTSCWRMLITTGPCLEKSSKP